MLKFSGSSCSTSGFERKMVYSSVFRLKSELSATGNEYMYSIPSQRYKVLSTYPNEKALKRTYHHPKMIVPYAFKNLVVHKK